MHKSQSDFRRSKKGAKFVLYPTVVMAFLWLIGAVFGCSIDEGGGSPCEIIGIDIGPFLNTVAAFAGLIFAIVLFPATLYSLANLASGYVNRMRERKSQDDV